MKIIFTSAGNPKTWIGWLKERGITVVHIVSSSRFAVKCEEAGVDAVVAEGFEAGGHNGREETTTFCLIPAVREQRFTFDCSGRYRYGRRNTGCYGIRG